PATAADLGALFARAADRASPLPLARLRQQTIAFGPVHAAVSGNHPRVVIATALPRAEPPGGPGPATLILIADVSLQPLARRIRALSSEGAEALLLDAEERVMADLHGAHAVLHTVDHPSATPAQAAAVAPYLEDGVEMLGAFARVRGHPFSILVRQRSERAYAAVTALRRRTALLVLLSALLAALLAA